MAGRSRKPDPRWIEDPDEPSGGVDLEDDLLDDEAPDELDDEAPDEPSDEDWVEELDAELGVDEDGPDLDAIVKSDEGESTDDDDDWDEDDLLDEEEADDALSDVFDPPSLPPEPYDEPPPDAPVPRLDRGDPH